MKFPEFTGEIKEKRDIKDRRCIKNKRNITDIKNIKKYIMLSGIAGMLACILILGEPTQRMNLAWWGFLYPEYCFGEVINSGEEADSGKTIDSGKVIDSGKTINSNREIENENRTKAENRSEDVKISFWLAKVFDW